MKTSWKTLAALSLALALLLPAARVLANVAANTEIFTKATLTYDDGTTLPDGSPDLKTSEASVTVTIALVPGPAVLSKPGPQSAVYAKTDTVTSYSYDVTAGGNGPDWYTLGIAVTGALNTNSDYSIKVRDEDGTLITFPYDPFPLGATVTAQSSTTSQLKAPFDGNDNGEVNGIKAGDTVVVDLATGQEIGVVKEVSEDSATNTATITLEATSVLTTAPDAGVSVWERRTFDVEVLSGTIDDVTKSIDLTVDASVTNSGLGDSHQVISTYTSGAAVLTKFARNMTTAENNNSGTGGKSFTVNGSTATYYTGGLKAVQNDQIQYILVVENAGTASVTDCDIHDILPSAEYVDFLTGLYGGKDFLYVDEAGNETNLTATADADTASVSGENITLYVGTGATSSAGGEIAVEKNVKVLYRIQVK